MPTNTPKHLHKVNGAKYNTSALPGMRLVLYIECCCRLLALCLIDTLNIVVIMAWLGKGPLGGFKMNQKSPVVTLLLLLLLRIIASTGKAGSGMWIHIEVSAMWWDYNPNTLIFLIHRR